MRRGPRDNGGYLTQAIETGQGRRFQNTGTLLEYHIDNVEFDDFVDGKLVEIKGNYGFRFGPDFTEEKMAKLVAAKRMQATKQVNVSNAHHLRLVWRVDENDLEWWKKVLDGPIFDKIEWEVL